MIARRTFLARTGAALLLPGTARASATEFTVQDREGRAHAARSLIGKVTLVHFWASWCASCRTEFPALDRLNQDLSPKGLVLLAISIDRLGWPVIESTLQALNVPRLPVFHDLNRVAAQSLKIEALPTTLLLDREGREFERLKGSVDWDEADIREKLSRHL